MTDQQICDEYERLVAANKLKWIKVSHNHLPKSTSAYCRMWLDDNKIKYKVASLRLGGTILFKVDDKIVHYLHHDPKKEKHMWADEGFRSFIENNEALAQLAARHSKSSKEAIKILFDGLDAVQGSRKGNNMALNYNEYGVLSFDEQDLFAAAADAAVKVLKPMLDAATPLETRLITHELGEMISCRIGEIRMRKALTIRDAQRKAGRENYGLIGHFDPKKGKTDGSKNRRTRKKT